ncbi:hypothetical protein CSH63_32215 [Micromonospora tulbaghiae]|uniref:Uncharacterized protein n=1 Tax=Micromonospora tulbaghiae TaxID=479978 RepID=A0A386WUY1_9ACTN|nr:hypothetical protein [Micromonospora tulbaghiae]AYF32021.1 hypothetical protein CSH63_32215 [Micromonospora tulbaghiae]
MHRIGVPLAVSPYEPSGAQNAPGRTFPTGFAIVGFGFGLKVALGAGLRVGVVARFFVGNGFTAGVGAAVVAAGVVVGGSVAGVGLASAAGMLVAMGRAAGCGLPQAVRASRTVRAAVPARAFLPRFADAGPVACSGIIKGSPVKVVA